MLSHLYEHLGLKLQNLFVFLSLQRVFRVVGEALCSLIQVSNFSQLGPLVMLIRAELFACDSFCHFTKQIVGPDLDQNCVTFDSVPERII